MKDEVVSLRNMETALRAPVVFVPQSSRTLKGHHDQRKCCLGDIGMTNRI